MKETIYRHLVMIGIPLGVWSLTFLLDYIHRAKEWGIFAIIGMVGYLIFSIIISKKSEKRSSLRLYPLIAMFLLTLAITMTFR